MNRFAEMARIILKILELKIEAETRTVELRVRKEAEKLRGRLVDLCIWSALLLISTVLFLSGLGFLTAGIYSFLSNSIGPGGAGLIIGIVVLLLSFLLFVIGKLLIR